MGRELPAQPVPGLLDTPHSKGPLEQRDAGGQELKVGLRSGGDSWWLDAAHEGGREQACGESPHGYPMPGWWLGTALPR